MMELSVVQKIVSWSLPVLFAITLHEVAHGWMASRLGDPTARLMGRLSLNPIKHIDLVGTIIVPVLLLWWSDFIFGWAKPVPVDPRNFRYPRRDTALVAIAGPLANILMALLWAAVAKGGVYLQVMHIDWLGNPVLSMGMAGIMINAVLAVLNLLPFPPLDGSKLFYSILPSRWVWHIQRLESLGFILLMLLWISGILSYLLSPPIIFLMQWLTGLFALH